MSVRQSLPGILLSFLDDVDIHVHLVFRVSVWTQTGHSNLVEVISVLFSMIIDFRLFLRTKVSGNCLKMWDNWKNLNYF